MRSHLITRAMAALVIVLGLAFGSTGASAAGKGETCGGIFPITCDKGLWCQNPAGECKVINAQGKCDVIPRSCPRDVRPVHGQREGGEPPRRRVQQAQRGRAIARSPHHGGPAVGTRAPQPGA